MPNGSISPGTAFTTPDEDGADKSSDVDTVFTIPRSASYTQLSEETKPDVTPNRVNGIRRSFSENVLAKNQMSRQNSMTEGADGSVKSRRSLRRLGSIKSQKSTISESEPKITVSKFTIGANVPSEDLGYEPKTQKGKITPGHERKPRSFSGSLSTFARRSWMSSRSPSPSPSKRRSHKGTDASTDEVSISGYRPSSRSGIPSNFSTDGTLPLNTTVNGQLNNLPRTSTVFAKKSRRPLSSILSKTTNTDTPSVPPIPKTYSTDRLPTLHHKSSTLSITPAVPKSKSFERLQGMGTETPRRKDELWSAFRALDGEYQKFQSRPGTLKTAVVRTALLPFLRSFAEHPSILSLRPEDLDRRTVILNKWWTGLLEMLNGRHGESVSGNDRPAILEAVTSLMVRQEWTLPPLVTSARPGKSLRASLKSRSTTSLGSTISDFLSDSVYHNVRNTFTQNLLAQMAYVVDKMSTRNVAASVVTFCGKAIAYAFFYCEGIAEILVRLWATPQETLRRVLVENGVRKEAKLDNVSEKICAAFPPCLHLLTLKSLRPTMRYLRSEPHVPIATSYIPWHGPWINRWAGRDTDLFFVFSKFYTDLACRYIPDDLTWEERMAAPGWALVQAQILTILDATIQPISSQLSVDHPHGASSITFDDMLGEADVSAPILPLPPHGVVRSMAENRLIMLLRDCLSSSTVMAEKTQHVFAESFCILLKATTRHTSMFDHNACFTLCDFLEESIAILTRYQQTSAPDIKVLDWPFWLEAYKLMLKSQNSMTEVRLWAFIYGVWGTISSNEDAKTEMVIGWLLTEGTFQAQFNHWCPMVRAFFMRLLMWRVARLDGSISDTNALILKILGVRLQEVWRNFLYLHDYAETNDIAAPSTVPCSPAPGRRLLIMRNDTQSAPAGMFLSFDGILTSAAASKVNPYERHSSLEPLSQGSKNQSDKNVKGSNRPQDGGKKRWNVLKMFSSFPGDQPKTSLSSHRARQANVSDSGKAISHSHVNGSPQVKPKIVQNGEGRTKPQSIKATDTTPAFRSLSFKFSLEWIDRDNNIFGRERKLQPPSLPLPALLSLQSLHPDISGNDPSKPEGVAVGPSKYAGRALAEWAILINECQNFFERRRAEGVPMYNLVETPTLGVEPFRKI